MPVGEQRLALNRLQLPFEPGSRFSYNNSGYFLLGVIAEAVTGQPYAEALRRHVLDPLGLDDIGYAYTDRIIEREARGYTVTLDGFERAEYIDASVPLSAGMLYATTGALHRWTQALRTGQVLPDSLYQVMTTPHTEGGYGYGLFIQQRAYDDQPVTIIEHGGGINGFTSALRYVEEDDYTVVVLDNTQGHSTGRIADGITQLFYDQTPPAPQPSIAQVMWDVLQRSDFAAARQRYQTLKQEAPSAYEFGTGELVRLGSTLLENDRAETAVEAFRFAVAQDSTSAEAHAGLGKALLEIRRCWR